MRGIPTQTTAWDQIVAEVRRKPAIRPLNEATPEDIRKRAAAAIKELENRIARRESEIDQCRREISEWRNLLGE